MTRTSYRTIKTDTDKYEVWSSEDILMGTVYYDGFGSWSCYGRHGNYIASWPTKKDAVEQVTVR
jgi:hypothetical protein